LLVLRSRKAEEQQSADAQLRSFFGFANRFVN